MKKKLLKSKPSQATRRIAHVRRGVTLVELMVTISVSLTLLTILVSFTATNTRLAIRNFATNQTHQTARIAFQDIVLELNKSASLYRLVDVNSSTGAVTVVTPTQTNLVAPGTTYNISQGANGIQFWAFVGGPYQINSITNGQTFTITNNTSNGINGTIPLVGDRFYLDSLERQANVTNVAPAGPGLYSLTLDRNLNAALSPGAFATATLYRSTTYYVRNGRLIKVQPQIGGTILANAGTTVATSVTSPKPFSLTFSGASAAGTGDQALLSLESYDSDYTARRFVTGTCSLNTLVSLRVRPAYITRN
jgi:prepilin-type N-terminal cleavage/methylation domain-containing protein